MYWGCIAMINKDVMVLQIYPNLEKVLPGRYGETYPTSDDANQTEELSDAEEEESPVPISFPKIEAEPEVSSMSTVRHVSQICRNTNCLLFERERYCANVT
jgi:hypothetical protein